MSSSFTYRPLVGQDLAAYHAIRLECLQKYPLNFGTFYEEALQAESLKFTSVLEQGHDTDFLMGVFNGTELIGICGFNQEIRLKTKHIGDLSTMYVKSQHVGKGIGTALLAITLEKAFQNIGLEQIGLGVVASNTAAVRLYQKAGFEQYGFLKRYFKYKGQYEDMIFMVLFSPVVPWRLFNPKTKTVW